MKKQTIVIIILVVLLVILVAYIVRMKWQQREFSIFQAGANAGYQQAILEIMGKAAKCEAVPLYAGNTTLNLVAIECLQQKNSQTQN